MSGDFYLVTVPNGERTITYFVECGQKAEAVRLITSHYAQNDWPLSGPIQYKHVTPATTKKSRVVEIHRG